MPSSVSRPINQASSEVVLTVLGKCVTPPSIRVQPDEVTITLSKGGITDAESKYLE
jgi:hypothetical protein